MKQRIAACGCGSLRIICRGDPDLVSLCHCTDCQKRTGTPFGIAAFFRDECVESRGVSRIYERGADSGYRVRFHFCPDCGSTVYWHADRKQGLVAVAVGCFADPRFPAPVQEVFTGSRHAWIPELSHRD